MRHIKRLAVVAVFVALALAMGPALQSGDEVQADGGPHGGYSVSAEAMPSDCADCHRAHSAESASRLLHAPNPNALCITCHGGTNSLIDVVNGVKLNKLDVVTPAVATNGRSDAHDGGRISILQVADRSGVGLGIDDSIDYLVSLRNTGDVDIEFTGTASALSGDTTKFGAIQLCEEAAPVVLPHDQTTTGPDCATPVLWPQTSAVGDGLWFYLRVTSLATALTGETLGVDMQFQGVSDPGGANTAVVYDVGVDSEVGLSIDPQDGGNLLGGGFVYQNGLSATSRHLDPFSAAGSAAAWGWTGVNTGQTGAMTGTTQTGTLNGGLTCVSCHNPHGSDNYRILQEKIGLSTPQVQAFYLGSFTANEGGEGSFGPGRPALKYVEEFYGSFPGQSSVDSFCGACHSAYAVGGDGNSTLGLLGGVTHYRHATEETYSDYISPEGEVQPNPETSPLVAGDGTTYPALRLASAGVGSEDQELTCLTCHFAHGTSAAWTNAHHDAPSAAGDTALMYLDNVGVCQACHRQ
jgi:predicted CXXCH cytochrome family protein